MRENLELYFRDLDGEVPHSMHQMLISTVEKPLLELVMAKAQGNQSKAAEWLGINRNTLRRKLTETQTPLIANNSMTQLTALISVSDKTGILEFAQALHRLNVRLLSTGGTAKLLAEWPSTPVSRKCWTAASRTLHPKIHGGLLARRDLPEHVAAIEKHGIDTIDILAVNLYPFEATVARPGLHAGGRDREHRHRRPGDGAQRGQELEGRDRPDRLVAVRPGPRRTGCRRQDQRQDPLRLLGGRLQPHRPVRRRDQQLPERDRRGRHAQRLSRAG